MSKEDIEGVSPPSVFVGRIGYPHVYVGPLVPPVQEDTSLYDLPEKWFLPEQQDRTVHFFDSQYEKGKSEEKMRELFPVCSNIDVSGMSLRDIFVVFAKKFKISKL